MAYDEMLAARFRQALGGMADISEKRMMGGVCFLLDGNMIGGADRTKAGEGRFMFRVGKENEVAARALPGGQQMEQGGRRMGGFFFVAEGACTDQVMTQWLSLALSFVSTLPPK